MNQIVPIVLALIGVVVAAYGAFTKDALIANLAVILVGLAVLLPLIFK